MTEHYDDESNIRIYGHEAHDGMGKAGKLAGEVLDYITPFVKTGVSTGELDKLMHEFIVEHGAVPAPLNYRGFPNATCISINHVVCHGIPSFDRVLKATDTINIDTTVILDGWYGDTSRMYFADESKAPIKANKLVQATYECLWRGIEMVKPGNTFGDIGHAIQEHAEEVGYGVVRDFVGHGIGRAFHESPNVFHFGKAASGATLKEGMMFTIEPMINVGNADTKVLADGWTSVTRDKSLSAQAEHTLIVTADGYKVFTESQVGLHQPPYKVG